MRRIIGLALGLLMALYATGISAAAQSYEDRKTKKMTINPNNDLDVVQVACNICALYDMLRDPDNPCTGISKEYKVRLHSQDAPSDYAYRMKVELAMVKDRKGLRQTLLEFKRDRPWKPIEEAFPHSYFIKEQEISSKRRLFLVACNDDKMFHPIDLVVKVLFSNDVNTVAPGVREQFNREKSKERCLIV